MTKEICMQAAGSKIAVARATGRVGRHIVAALEERGHDVVAMSRSAGVDVITGDGLAPRPTNDEEEHPMFFVTSAHRQPRILELGGHRWQG